MKTKFICMLVLSVFLFIGVQSISSVNLKLNTAPLSKVIKSTEFTTTTSRCGVTTPKSRDESIEAGLKAAAPAIIPQLKSEVDSEFSSIKDSLNSIDDVKYIDLSSKQG